MADVVPISICGATATGKTALALMLAAEYGGEIISCDSMQIYRGMDIGTAKPTEAERALYYRRAPECRAGGRDAAAFFSEVAPCGVIGSFLPDVVDGGGDGNGDGIFTFKHHYITGTLDSGIMCELLSAMHEKRDVTVSSRPSRSKKTYSDKVTPLRIFISAGGGREYLLAYDINSRRVLPFRLDNIISADAGEVCPDFDARRAILDRMLPHIWGVDTQGSARLEHVSFTVYHRDDEEHIPARLEREKRCGSVERLDKNHTRFEADVYDANELFPFIRTFICRITKLEFSDKRKDAKFRRDLEAMYALYGLDGEGDGESEKGKEGKGGGEA